MFRIRFEKTKNSSEFINYFVDDRVCAIINDILLTQGFIEASTESWHDIQKYHGHRVRVSIGPKTESSDSGIEKSLQALPVSLKEAVPVNDRITKLESEINIALKELSSLKKAVQPEDVKPKGSFDLSSLKGIWGNSRVSDKAAKPNTGGSLPSTTNTGKVWAPDSQEKNTLEVKTSEKKLTSSLVTTMCRQPSDEGKGMKCSEVKLTGAKPLKRIQRDDDRTSRFADAGSRDIPPIGYL